MRGGELVAPPQGESTDAVRARVERCRALQRERNGPETNAEVGLERLEKIAALGRDEATHLGAAICALGLTARSWHRVIRVARTIADLGQRETISRSDLSEALTYRVLEERGRGQRLGPQRTERRVVGDGRPEHGECEQSIQEVSQCR